MTTILKGDTSAAVTVVLAAGYDYSGATVEIAYQGVVRRFTGVSAGSTVDFTFTAKETSVMALGAFPVHAKVYGADGRVTTVNNKGAKICVTNIPEEVYTDGVIAIDIRGGLYELTDLPERYTDKDIVAKIREILRKGGAVLCALLVLSSFAASVTKTNKEDVYNDQGVVTDVDLSGLAAERDVAEEIARVEALTQTNANAIGENRIQIEANAAQIATNSADIAAVSTAATNYTDAVAATKADKIKYVGTNSYELADCDWVCEWDGARLEGDGETWVLRQDDLGRALICGHAFGKLGTIYYERETVGTNRVEAAYYLPIYHPSDRQYDPNPEYTLYLDNFNELVFDTLADGTPASTVRRLIRTGSGGNVEYPIVYKDSLDALADSVNSRLETKADAEQASVVTNAAEWRVQRMNVHIALSLYNRTSDYWNDTYFMRKVSMWHAAGPPTKLWVWDSGDQYFRLGWYDPAEYPYGVNGYIAEWHFTGGDAHYFTAPSAEDEGLLGFVDNVTAEWVVETAIVTNKVVYSDTTDALSAHVNAETGKLSDSVAELDAKKADKYIFEVGDTWVDDSTGDVYDRLRDSKVWTNETTQAYIEWRDNDVPAIEHDGAWFFVLPRIDETPPDLFVSVFGFEDDSHVTFYNRDDPSEATDIRQFTRTYPVVTNVVNYIRIEYDAVDGRPIFYTH